ncbi:MAG TPA: heavy metal translocating P-type ATPase [Steroidobacteraceae bacterium]|nr:heavy metal translocating P-type ATPase [Steroidobacteraceae bacterium]
MRALAIAPCFHCGEPLAGSALTARIADRNEPVCCRGCLAVAELIAGAGLTDYYRLRANPGVRPERAPNDDDRWTALSRPDVASRFVRSSGDTDSVTLAVDGLRCAACSWLIDRMLCALSGVTDASTNAATGRTHVRWRRSQLALGDVARCIADLGYRPQPLGDGSAAELQQHERRDALKRLAVAGFGMMQVMMFAVAVYAADLSHEVIDAPLLKFFRIVSLLVTTPVVFYAGAPIFEAAWRNLQTRTLGMDVPVALALALAYGASLYNALWAGAGEVYFDSVTMFIFFLTLARYVQMLVRHRTIGLSDALARQLPDHAHRVNPDGTADVPIAALRVGEVVLVRRGEILPADGELLDAEAHIDEAMLTGESIPVSRHAGERVAAGTLNVGNPVQLRVLATATGTTLSRIVSLLQHAQAQKPAMAGAADVAATHFLRYVLLAAGLTCATWLVLDPARAFPATLAVLVVACPCAFAIATPAAIAAAIANLARRGVLVTRIDALEALARIDRIVFDKTGTLTRGDIVLGRSTTLGRLPQAQCRRLAGALEVASEHPLARAFESADDSTTAENVRSIPGAGMEGVIEGRRYRIGTAQFVAALRGSTDPDCDASPAGTVVVLGDEQEALARFELHDAARANAGSAVSSLVRMQVSPLIMSGDSETAVGMLAFQCGIQEYRARCTPEQKLTHLQTLQAIGHRVAMVGDGVNDAPVLGAADLAIAMGRGAPLAQTSADMILVGENLDAIPEAVQLARRMLRIARQNLGWAALYNFGSLPLAAIGLIPPWLAALGMSLSSMLVVLNAARLLPQRSKR